MNSNDEDTELEDLGPSKSQLKRDAQALVELGEKLLKIPEQQLPQIDLPEVVDAVLEAKKIRKGNARKRQMQFIGKLLRKSDTTALLQLINRFDASSVEHANQFHKLESWRERLITGDNSALDEIIAELPEVDIQHLRSLTRNASRERQQQEAADNPQPPVHFRKLFQYLKSLTDG